MRKSTKKYLFTGFEIFLNFGIIAILSVALTGNYWYDIKGADLSDQGFGKDFKIYVVSIKTIFILLTRTLLYILFQKESLNTWRFIS